MFRGSGRWLLSAVPVTGLLMMGCLVPSSEPAGDTTPADASNEDLAASNNPPVAVAGADQVVNAGDSVVLNGSDSTDADGDQLLFFWRQTGGKPLVSLEGGSSSRQQFEAPQVDAETELIFQLTVVDGTWSAADEVRVTVRPSG